MENKKGTTILLTVIGIATLLVVLVGATFAYFTASISTEGNSPDVNITAATLGTVTFDQGSAINLSGIYPNAMEKKEFSLKGGDGSVAYDYKISLNITTNTFTDEASEVSGSTNIQYQLCTKTSDADCQNPVEASWLRVEDQKTGDIVLKNDGELQPNATDKYVLFVRLLETGAAQDKDQAKNFASKIKVEVDGLDTTKGFTTDSSGNVIVTSAASE